LAHWLRTEVAFNVTSEQLTTVHNFLDNGGHYYIGKDAFVKSISRKEEEEEEENGK